MARGSLARKAKRKTEDKSPEKVSKKRGKISKAAKASTKKSRTKRSKSAINFEEDSDVSDCQILENLGSDFSDSKPSIRHARNKKIKDKTKKESQALVSHEIKKKDNKPKILHREFEYETIESFIRNRIEKNVGGCLYIYGLPGTGKTVTVRKVIESFKDNKDILHFHVNGVEYTNSRSMITTVARSILNKNVKETDSIPYLNNYFASSPKKAVIIIVDEFDKLCRSHPHVWYNLCEWSTRINSRLAFIAISNTMDLPERVLSKQTESRFGQERLCFSTYSFEQLSDLIKTKIDYDFEIDALNLVTRKVASVSGDVRKCITVCKKAIEVSKLDEDENSGQRVTAKHVEIAFSQLSMNSLLKSTLPYNSKQLLKAIHSMSTISNDISFIKAYKKYVEICSSSNEDLPSISNALRSLHFLIISNLVSSTDPYNPNSSVKLLVGAEKLESIIGDVKSS